MEPIYLKFLERFPDPRSLAAASVEEVDSAIRHLGLAYRAARIRSAARSLVEQYGGVVPAGVNALKRLAVGIGDYIAHAVMCFGFGQNVPVVDANVARIVRRVFSLSFGSSPHKSPILWDFVRKILPEGAAREFNWAIIDFGSLVCTPKEPLCRRCPMNRFCDYGSAVLAGRPPPAVQRASNLGLRRARHQ